MCGIVYQHNFDGLPVNNGILQQFDLQRARGTEGFGLFDGSHLNIVRASKEDKILKWLVKYESNLLMFHHRNPTSTINVKRAAHPFSTKDYFGDHQYIMVHNGVISGSYGLKSDHEKLGIKYQSELQDKSFNDSESLLWDLALHIEGKQDELKAKGMIAFVMVRLHKGKLDRLYFGRNESAPLNMYRDKQGIALSSEGVGEPIEADTLYNWNYSLGRLTHKPLQISRFVSSYVAPVYTPGSYAGNYHASGGGSYRDYDDDNDGYYGYLGVGRYNPPVQSSLPVSSGTRTMDDEYYDSLGFEDFTDVKFDHLEIEAKALHYLMRNRGVFQDAFTQAEDDACQILEDCLTQEEYDEMRLIECALDWLEADPEWTTDDSVSSIWGSLCQTN